MADLIDRAQTIKLLMGEAVGKYPQSFYFGLFAAANEIKELPAVDAVEVDALKAWLYEIAMNNTDNYLGDACEEIISRLDGLRAFARERRTDADNRC